MRFPLLPRASAALAKRPGRVGTTSLRLVAALWTLLVVTPVRSQEVPRAPVPATGTCDYDASPRELAAGGFRQVFREEFSGHLPAWTSWLTGAFNQELQLYQPANVSVRDGLLSIVARRQAGSGPANPADSTIRHFDFTSGRIESRRHFSASPATPAVRIAARIRLPRGYGLWPAFWTYGDPWPTAGELDILEARGEEPFVFQTAYWYGRTAGTNDVQQSDVPFRSTVDLTTCWHVYEVTWRRDSLTFRFDGRVVDVKRGGLIPAMFGQRQRVALNVAVGGHFFTNLEPARIEPGVMQVDWVRVLTGR